MNVAPFFNSPFTDLTGHIVTHQWNGKCEKFEMQMINCFEAYGRDRGMEKCAKLMADFRECANCLKQEKRALAMRFERHRQHFSGEVKRENKYAPGPAPHSY